MQGTPIRSVAFCSKGGHHEMDLGPAYCAVGSNVRAIRVRHELSYEV